MSLMQYIRDLKTVYRGHRKGWSNDKGKTMKHMAKIPMEYIFHPEYRKYFDPQMDRHEDRKNTDAFLKKFPQFDLRRL